ncbi:hypothetical protein PDN54_16920 [Bacillus cereus group sp. Bc252]|nr:MULTISPECIES: hypothetical protein [Bacillus cereus group]MCU5208236.1 hypothetical protein [Bacillus paranthracis]MCX3319078.1 hypothetical protein [Bacillus paranthracis]MDA1589960.1 hypothetical protein [Bacillus cereus group sp. TH225LC]MDA2161948.1 hypothetical protein [Bacillus cereus group sp. Bc252]MDF9509496.1 hypothetical protein [Bacillus paranthracis]
MAYLLAKSNKKVLIVDKAQ